MKKKMEQFLFNAFGFPVLLHDVLIGETESGEPYLDINMKILEEAVAKTLIASSHSLSGVKLKFLRNLLNLSLRELGQEIDVPHTSLKLWEDGIDKNTGLEMNQEKRLKYLVLLYIQTREQKEFSKSIFESKPQSFIQEGPLEIASMYKYGA
jgi:DNA-binding transcriptional regulator YiaG